MLDATPHILRTLLHDGRVSEAELERIRAEGGGGDAVETLRRLEAERIVDERTIAIVRASVCERPFIDLGAFEIDYRNAGLVPRSVAESLGAFPLFVVDGVATVALADPLDLHAVDQLRAATGCEVDPVLCPPSQLRELIARAYSIAGISAGSDTAAEHSEEDDADEPIVAAVNQVLFGAVEAGASDIHINPDDGVLHLRYRVDGVLRSQQGPPISAHQAIVQRLKVLARLDLTETRRPQDGKFRFFHRGAGVDVRLSTLPTIHGENVVLRLLQSGATVATLDELGMPPAVRSWFGEAIERPHGMILVTGPTGSGKTTTLYTAIQRINAPERNIMTIEDPVEYRLPMIRQVQVSADVGLGFAQTLRAILRQDPDVVLVGEIRDAETAAIATQAALTGHLVFSTMHTNDAASSVTRLIDLGVPAFAINGAVLGAIAQRLVRKLCPSCSEERPARPEDLAWLDAPPAAYRGPVGCPACQSVGYRGRVGVYEAMTMSPELRSLVDVGAPVADLRAEATQQGMRSLAMDGLDKAVAGVTSLAEVRRLVGEAPASRGAERVRMSA